MTLKKSERKERLIEIHKMLRIESATVQQIKDIRSKVACLLGEDTGLYIFEEPIVLKKER